MVRATRKTLLISWSRQQIIILSFPCQVADNSTYVRRIVCKHALQIAKARNLKEPIAPGSGARQSSWFMETELQMIPALNPFSSKKFHQQSQGLIVNKLMLLGITLCKLLSPFRLLKYVL